MLQQTTTATVEGYYQRFLERFPNVHSLAKAELEDVYRLWEGLGYYRRAAQLHKAAIAVVENHGGIFPQTFEHVLALPGVGRYTAGAILSIAHDKRLPILEANTIRLHSRLFGVTTDPLELKTNLRLWAFAEKVLPQKNIGIFNQALMDLGSRVCLPKQPLCLGEANLFSCDTKKSACPVADLCQCARLGLQREIPVPKAKPNMEEITEVAVLVRRRGKILLMQYPESVRWAGLWDFPRCQANGSDIFADSTIPKKLGELTGRSITLHRPISTQKHAVTRFKITLRFVEGKDCGPLQKPQYNVRWVKPEELEEIPLNSTGRKLAVETQCVR